jgi:hypothetical protein
VAYCTQDDVKLAANRWTALDTGETARVTDAINKASAYFESQTGSFFDQRTIQVTSEPLNAMQRRLFMPAPVISLTSVVEAGIDITSNVLIYKGWLEKNAQAIFNWPGDPVNFYWANQQQAVVVIGVFGYAATPADVVQVVAFLAAQILGWVEKTFITPDGISQSIRDNTLPPWAKDIINTRTLQPFDAQVTQWVQL